MQTSPKGTIRKRKVIRSRSAEARVWSNIGGIVYPKPGIGEMWSLNTKFVQKTGTPIRYSLRGDNGIKTLYQRCNRADMIKRLLASICYCEAVYDLGYRNAAVWIGDQRFQPRYEDLRSAGMTKEEITTFAGKEAPTNGGRKKRSDTEQEEDEMAAKKKSKGKKIVKRAKGKKGKKSKSSSGDRAAYVTPGVRFEVEEVRSGIRVMVKGKPKTKQVLSWATLEKSVNKAAYGYTDRHIGSREKIGNKGGGLANRLRAMVSSDAPSKKSKKGKKGKKSGKTKVARKVKGRIVKKISKRGKKKGKR